jgi:cytochrome P450
MSTEQQNIPSADKEEARCPIDHSKLARQKTARSIEANAVPIECDEAGVWHVRGFDEARAILRNGETKQAGFNAELLERLPNKMKPPILYQEGKVHHQQRKMTARYFTPKVVSSSYRQLMERLVEQSIQRLERKKKADLSDISLQLAVRVASEVVGLTNSRLPGMAARLDAFFAGNPADMSVTPRTFLRFLKNQSTMLAFFLLDVKPAIQARRRSPREDVISHLVSQGANDGEILTECITYAAAGMATTREFISAAAWHFLEHPELRERYLAAPEEERHELLSEVLRLEPVVGNIYRRATADLHITSNGAQVVIPAGAKIDLRVHGTNTDESVVGEHPLEICPGRALKGDNIPAAVMSFGDGHHRCPGSYIAIQETDMLLRRLLVLDGLRIERLPDLSWNDLVTGYELRKFIIAID